MSHSNDVVNNLNQLKAGHSYLSENGPSAKILECFENKFPDNIYMDRYDFPEFTSLCPVTGQPDFATIIFEYIPDKLCIETKSFKVYMFAYRAHQSFMETTVNNILKDMVEVSKPRWARVIGFFAPRGGTAIKLASEYVNPQMDSSTLDRVLNFVSSWKMETRTFRA